MPIPVITQLETPFAYDPDVETIQTVPQLPSGDPNNASFEKGFPAITMPLTGQTGLPPKGQDFNGILNEICQLLVWYSTGGGFSYNGIYNPSNPFITGYPIGARVKRADNQGYWLNLTDDNQTDPDDAGTSAGWVPDNVYGFFNLIIPTNVTIAVTLTIQEAAFSNILINEAVALTLPVTITLPSALIKSYFIKNATSVNLIFQTDAIGSPILTIPPGGCTLFAVLSGTYIIDLSQYYLTIPDAIATYAPRPNVGYDGYFEEQNSALTSINITDTQIPLVHIAGEIWTSGGVINVPFNGSFTGVINMDITVTTVSPDTIYLAVLLNGAGAISTNSITFVNSGTLPWNISFTISAAAGDTLEIIARQSIGSVCDIQITFATITAIAN